MKLRPSILWISVLALFLALAGLFYLGFFTRFMADDFCVAGQVLERSLSGMVAEWYATINGRFMAILVSSLILSAGPALAGWMPLLAGLIWLIGLTWAVLPLTRRSAWPHPNLLAAFFSGITLLVLLSSTPNLYQSFIWHSGMVTYSLPLVGLVFSAGIILRVWLENSSLLQSSYTLFILSFLWSGFSEVVAVMQVVFFFLLCLLALLAKDKDARRRMLILSAAALFASLAATLLILVAPGNQVRLEHAGMMADRPGLLRIVIFSLRNMAHIVGKYFIWTPLWAAISIIPPFLAGWLFSTRGEKKQRLKSLNELIRQDWFKAVVLILGFALVLVTAACMPVVYGLNAYPDDRVIIMPQFILVMAAVSTSLLLGFGLGRMGVLPSSAKKDGLALGLQTLIMVIILLAVSSSLWQTAAQVPLYRSFARSWDARAAEIQQAALAGENQVIVPGGSSLFGVGNLNADPHNWINKCMASYYQIPEIIGR